MRAAQQERHAERGLVQQDAVAGFAVLAQALAVVGEHDDHRVVGVSRRDEALENAAELRVGEGDLAVVGPLGEALAEGRRAARRARAGRRSGPRRRRAPAPPGATRGPRPRPRWPDAPPPGRFRGSGAGLR